MMDFLILTMAYLTVTYVTSSQAGNPLCTSVSLATLEELSKPGVYENMFEKVDNLKREAAKIIEQKSVDAQVVGDGHLDIAFTKDKFLIMPLPIKPTRSDLIIPSKSS